ncbi:MAG: HAD hydrolase family protein [Treponema sp.]|jgi:Cof subfamily protein (haloacid dehalogenase superfamily)|nr:HAD hydrolase family protein [Treponema sp.]
MAKALFLDIDGTLILWDKGPFAEDIAAITEARKRGYYVFLCTGRSLGNIPRAFLDAPYIDGMICGCGAQVILGGNTIYQTWIPEDVLALVCGFYLGGEKWCVFEGEKRLYTVNSYEPFRFAVEAQKITGKNDFSQRYADERVAKVTIQGAASGEERDLLCRNLTLNPFPDYFEGVIKGESKSRGMEALLRAAGIDRRDTIAIGDSLNDMDMIQYAGLGVAMGNACGELKRAAQAVTLDCGQGGVGYAIRNWA